jgi:hypothetical protein
VRTIKAHRQSAMEKLPKPVCRTEVTDTEP